MKSRTIKFRAWIPSESKMMTHDELFSGTAAYYQNPFTQSDLVLMQFTGLEDKKGREIYEGDILTLHYGEDSQPAIVTWSKGTHGGWIFLNPKLKQAQIWSDDCEVTGNIYDDR
jgi:uncharacterized phage protein (TIGR01671 family)